MIRVTTSNLSPDAASADVFHELRELGEVRPAELQELLRTFTRIDPVQNQECDPQIHAVGEGAKLVIRTSRGRLFAYDPRDPASPATECTAEQILDRLRETARPPGSPASVAPHSGGSDSGSPLPSPAVHGGATPRRGIAIAMLVAGLALNGYAVHSAVTPARVNKAPPVTLLTDPREIDFRLRAVAGTYATGGRPGSRVIVVSPGGAVRFYEIGARSDIDDLTDAGRIGRHDGRLCLATPECGAIDITGPDSLVYFKDLYQRLPPR